MAKVDSLLNWQTSHHIFVDVNDLVLLENLRLSQNCLVSQIDRCTIDLKIPITEDLLVHEKTNEVVDVFHLLLRVHAANCKAITHARTSTDTIRHAINTAEFRRQMNHVFAVFDNDQRLFMVGDILAIDVGHILGDTNLFIVVNEFLGRRVDIEVNARNNVGTLVTPISNDTRSDDL